MRVPRIRIALLLFAGLALTLGVATAIAAATGGANGHVALSNVAGGSSFENYSFNAVAVGSPPAAKGQIEIQISDPSTGERSVVKGSVDCITIVGNKARIAATFDSERDGNVDAPIPPGLHLVWTVEDNGEGSNALPDRASEVFSSSAAQGAFHCAVGFSFPLHANEGGNIQVSPDSAS